VFITIIRLYPFVVKDCIVFLQTLYILDECLKVFISTENRQRAFNIIQLQDEFLNRNPKLLKGWSKDLTQEVIVKLIKDEFVRIDTDVYKNPPIFKGDTEYFMITIEGIIFLEHKGYVKLFEKEKHQKKIQNLKDWLLIFGATLAGIGAVALVIWEIYKKYCLKIN